MRTIDERDSHRFTGHRLDIAFADTQDGSAAIEKAIEYLKSAKKYLDTYYPKTEERGGNVST